MVSFYNCIVFGPNRDVNSIEYIYLLKLKKHLRYVYHREGGGRVSYVYLNASSLRHRYFGVDAEDDNISQGNYVVELRYPGSAAAAAAARNRQAAAAGTVSSPEGRHERALRDGDAEETCEQHDSVNVPTRFIILYHHGNAEDLGVCYQMLKWLSFTFEVDVVCSDYRGYGFSGYQDMPFGSFTPTEASVYEDADLMYNHLLDRGYHPSQIIVMGRSLGGGPACYLAEKHHQEIAGLVLESCFSSCLSVISTALPLLRCMDMFPNKRRLQAATGCPILLMHGDQDEVVPFRCSEELEKTVVQVRRKRLSQFHKAREKRLGKGAKRGFEDNGTRGDSAGDKKAAEPHLTASGSNGNQRPTSGHSPVATHLSQPHARLPRRGMQQQQLHDERDGERDVDLELAEYHSSQELSRPKRKDATAGDGRGAQAPPTTAAARQAPAQHYGATGHTTNEGVLSPMSPLSPHLAAQTTPCEELLAEVKLRSYANGVEWAHNETETDLGVFHQWFHECLHNDLETRLPDLYVTTFTRFLAFVADTAPLPKSLSHTVPCEIVMMSSSDATAVATPGGGLSTQVFSADHLHASEMDEYLQSDMFR